MIHSQLLLHLLHLARILVHLALHLGHPRLVVVDVPLVGLRLPLHLAMPLPEHTHLLTEQYKRAPVVFLGRRTQCLLHLLLCACELLALLDGRCERLRTGGDDRREGVNVALRRCQLSDLPPELLVLLGVVVELLACVMRQPHLPLCVRGARWLPDARALLRRRAHHTGGTRWPRLALQHLRLLPHPLQVLAHLGQLRVEFGVLPRKRRHLLLTAKQYVRQVVVGRGLRGGRLPWRRLPCPSAARRLGPALRLPSKRLGQRLGGALVRKLQCGKETTTGCCLPLLVCLALPLRCLLLAALGLGHTALNLLILPSAFLLLLPSLRLQALEPLGLRLGL
mmetsp:Transcript_12260/g.33618  ORF Transcript_12260/g.33618 Transcript_12260/m.33618 type:complete len:337 (-) Transcript_12260:154-1164(-)